MDKVRLEELKAWVKQMMKFGVSEGNDLIALIDAELARSSTSATDVQEAIDALADGVELSDCETDEEYLEVHLSPTERDLAITALRAQIEPGWINVSERLPKIGVTCLGHTKTGRVMSVYVDKDGYWWSTGIGGASVTHWMPLPNPPRKDGDIDG